MRQVVLLTGKFCNGKSKLAQFLGERYGFRLVDTSEYLRLEAKKRSQPEDRQSLQKLGDVLDKETGSKWVFDQVCQAEKVENSNKSFVVDNVRTADQLMHFRRQHSWKVSHVHLYARTETLIERYAKKLGKSSKDVDLEEYKKADLIKSDEDIEGFKSDADIRIFTYRTDSEDTFIRVAAHLGLLPPPNRQLVDVLVGGQFGSEGKGHIAAYLAREYDVLMRVGGPNAGHTVAGPKGKYVYCQLPSGSADTNADILIGPGATLDVPRLLKEIEDCKIDANRLYIDPQAMVIEEEDKEEEKRLVEQIGSTGSGSGAAAARRIMGRLNTEIATKLARDNDELEPYVHSTQDRLRKAFAKGQFVLLEGTQGSGLSLYHGHYPHVTSRDTNVAGCLAEAGIPPGRVRRVLMVIRPMPIRVQNPDKDRESGPLKHEVTTDEIADAAGLDRKEVYKTEHSSRTNKPRRIGWFDWERFRVACALNAPTDIVLTFADYLKAENANARRFEQLVPDTIKFIEELERVAQAPVSLINTRFPRGEEGKSDLRSVIDRRNWWVRPGRADLDKQNS